VFVGRGRRDRFLSDGGDDVFRGGKARDQISFFDSSRGIEIDLFAGTATGEGRDLLASIEEVVGSKHDDTIVGSQGRDDIYAVTGDDSVYGLGGDDELTDAGGQDHFDGGEGDDLISTSYCVSASGGPTICQPDPPLPDTIIGGIGDDLLGGGPGNDVISGGRGDDAMDGGDGSDDLDGDAGDDILLAGNSAGEDTQTDDGKADDLDGGADTDRCGGGANDALVSCELPYPRGGLSSKLYRLRVF
jgi:Ca2+-binding RTX toxin-like protein